MTADPVTLFTGLRAYTLDPERPVVDAAPAGVDHHPSQPPGGSRGAGMRTGPGDHWLRVGGVKMYADGTLGSQTASMLEPFEGQPDNRGIAGHSAAALQELVGRAVAAGLWPTVHAIGDRANREVLEAFAAHREAARRAGVRFRARLLAGAVRRGDAASLHHSTAAPSAGVRPAARIFESGVVEYTSRGCDIT